MRLARSEGMPAPGTASVQSRMFLGATETPPSCAFVR